jgi:DNA-binding response OmpR family regulator
VLQELRARPETSASPVILMTGAPHKAGARFSMDQGADDYLPKPFAMEQLLATVSARLERQEGSNPFSATGPRFDFFYGLSVRFSEGFWYS